MIFHAHYKYWGIVFVLAHVIHREFADGKRFPAEVEKFLLRSMLPEPMALQGRMLNRNM